VVEERGELGEVAAGIDRGEQAARRHRRHVIGGLLRVAPTR
jgi:hypothetical protein